MRRIYFEFVAFVCSLLFAGNVVASPAHVVNSYPSTGSTSIPASTTIGITYSTSIDLHSVVQDSIRVFSPHGKLYAFHTKLSKNLRTLIITPIASFGTGERIIVHIGMLRTTKGEQTDPFDLTFTVAHATVTPDSSYHSDDPILERMLHKRHSAGKGGGTRPLTSIPGDWPGLNVMTDMQPYDGNVYMTNYRFGVSSQVGAFRFVLDKDGQVVTAFDGTPHYFNDFKPLGDGRYSYFDAVAEAFYVLDSAFNPIDSIRAANGYVTDGHEFRITPDGDYMILAGDYVTMDVSRYYQGGDTAAIVLCPVIQEFDADKNLVFQWRALDHFNVTDATHENLAEHTIDFCHSNAIEFDSDSNIILSSRHMDEITKIDRQTGDLMWRWGGLHNQFVFVGDTTPFSHQHAVRRLPNGHITMFDNGNFRVHMPSYSRAAEFELDEVNKTARLVWSFRHNPDLYGFAMGYVQRLPNGNTFIGWGACDDASVTEVDPVGTTQFEMVLDSSNYSYRAYKFDSTYNKISSFAAATMPITASTSIVCTPNPIRSTARISIALPNPGHVQISLFDALGRSMGDILDREFDGQSGDASLDARSLANGMYELRLRYNGAVVATEQLLVVK